MDGMMSTVRKAAAAFWAGGIAGAGVYLQSHSFHFDAETLAGAAGAFVAGGVLATIGVYFAPANRPKLSR